MIRTRLTTTIGGRETTTERSGRDAVFVASNDLRQVRVELKDDGTLAVAVLNNDPEKGWVAGQVIYEQAGPRAAAPRSTPSGDTHAGQG